MNELEKIIAERLAKIEADKATLTVLAKSLEQGLYDALVSNYDDLLDNFTKFYTLYATFAEKEFLPVIQEIIKTVAHIQTLNEDYFKSQQIARVSDINQKVKVTLYETFGLNGKGRIIPGGYLDSLNKRPDVSQNVSDFLLRESIAKRAKPTALKDLQVLVKGTPQQPGLYQNLLDQHVYDRLTEADRITQTVYATELGLSAAYYAGAVIRGTREFCRVRRGKIYLISEIKKFGTSSDQYGGYTDKSAGKFRGKPKGSYNPILQLGGVRCQHTFGFVSNAVALRLRSDLIEVNGKLVIKS